MPMGMGPCRCCGDCPNFITEHFSRGDGELGPNWTVDAGEWAIVDEHVRTATPDAMARYTGHSIASFNGFNWKLELDVYGTGSDVAHVYFFHRSTTPGPKFTRIELDYGTGLISVVEGIDGVETVRRVATADLTPDAWQHLTLCRSFQNSVDPKGLSVYLDGEFLFNVAVPLWLGGYEGPRNFLGLGTGDVAEDVRFDGMKLKPTTSYGWDGSNCPYCAGCLWPRLANREYYDRQLLLTAGDLSFSVVSDLYATQRPDDFDTCGWRFMDGPDRPGYIIFPTAMFTLCYSRPVDVTTVELVADVYFNSFGGSVIGASYTKQFDMTVPDALTGPGPYTLDYTWPMPNTWGMMTTLDVELV